MGLAQCAPTTSLMDTTLSDCLVTGVGGRQIPDIEAINRYSFQSTATYLLIVEKDAVFQVRPAQTIYAWPLCFCCRTVRMSGSATATQPAHSCR